MVTDEFDKEKLRQLLTEAELLYRRAKELNFSSEYVNGELMFEIKQLFPFQMQLNVNILPEQPTTLRQLLKHFRFKASNKSLPKTRVT